MRQADTIETPGDRGPAEEASVPRAHCARRLPLESLRDLVNRLPVNACLTDPEGRFLAVSDSYCRTYGYERSELLGRHYSVLVPPERCAEAEARYARRLAGEPVGPVKTPRIRKDGSVVLAQPEHQVLTVEGGRRILLSIVQDISELEEARATLRITEAQYRALAEQSHDAIVVADEQGTIMHWSLGAEEVFGIPREKALGANLGALHAEATILEPPPGEHLPTMHRKTEAFLQADPSRWQETLFEHSIRRPDGSTARVQTRVFPIQSGEVLLAGSITRDVTKARATEEALRKRAKQQKRLLETARHLTASLDLDVVLHRIAEEARDLLEASCCTIYLLESGGEVLRPMVAIEPPYEGETLVAPLQVHRSLAGQSVRLRRGVVINDPQEHAPDQRPCGRPLAPGERVITAPFVVEGEALGAMCLSRHGARFDDKDLTLAETLAAYAATALTNAYAHAEVQRQMEERRRAQSALRESEAQFRALAEHSTDVISRFDRSLRYVYANPASAQATGRPPQEMIGKTFRELGLPSDICSRWDAVIREVFRTGRPHRREFEVPTAAGPAYLDWRLVPEFAPDGTVATVLVTSRDISEAKRAEMALLESERFLSTLMSNLPGMAYRCANDDKWTMIYVSEGCRELTGYPPEELVANWTVAYGDLIHPRDRHNVRHQILTAVAAGNTFQFEYRIRTREGRERWVWERGRVAWVDGDQSVLEGFITDITDRKRAEQAQQAMHAIAQAAITCEGLKDLCGSIHDIVRRLMPAPNLYVALCDPASDTVSMIYFADEKETLRQSSRSGNRGVTEYIVRTGRTLLADRQRLGELDAAGEINARTAIPESYLGVPLRGHAGAPLGVLAVQSYDPSITYTDRERNVLEFVSSQIALALERKQAEEAVREERDFAHNLLDTAQSIVLVLDQEGRVLTYNRYTEAVTGQAVEQAQGLEWAGTFVPERQREEVRSRIQGVIDEGSVHGYVNLVRGADGRERLFEWHGARLSDSQGNVVGLLATGHDITERKRLEEQLLQSQKMETIGRLAGGVAHDFNNLLTAITGHAQFALEALPVGDPSRDELDEVLRAAGRAASLTRQLLAFSRRQIIEPRPVDLSELVIHTDKMLRRLIGENIELVTTTGSDPCVVRADPVQMEQVLINLVVNAREAMPNGGRLDIEVKPITLDSRYADRHLDLAPGDYVQLSVTDTGSGMNDEVKAHLFEPFYTTKTPDKGTGLGLATVYGIVHQHQGAVWAYSEVGQGSTFRVLLPRVGQAAERLPRRDDAGFLPVGNETVLVVEDEALVRKVVARALREQGYTVLQARNGREALQVARDHSGPIDLLLTDVVMPQMGGKELADSLREIRPDVSVLYVSGYTDGAIVHGGVLDEGTAFLQKPFTVSALARKTREVLDTRE